MACCKCCRWPCNVVRLKHPDFEMAPNAVWVGGILLRSSRLQTQELNNDIAKADLSSRRFREGIPFPNFVERSIPELPLSKLCTVPFALQNRALFEGEKWRKCAEKRGGRGVATKRGKKEKRTRENSSEREEHEHTEQPHKQTHTHTHTHTRANTTKQETQNTGETGEIVAMMRAPSR